MWPKLALSASFSGKGECRRAPLPWERVLDGSLPRKWARTGCAAAAEPRGLLSKMALLPRELALSYSRFSLVGYALRREAPGWSCSTAAPASACARGRPRLPPPLPVPPACGRGDEKVEPGASCRDLQERVRLGAQAEVQASVPRLLGSQAKKGRLGIAVSLSFGGPLAGSLAR